MAQTNPELYTVGGTVQANDRGLYIAREADAELLRLCRESTFAYVLTPRQMGKSSLMIRTAERLMEEGAQVVIIDLTQVGTQVSAAEWYRGVLALMAEQLELTTNIAAWWEAQSHLGVTQRLTQFFQQVILREVEGAIAIFVDEIDTTLSLEFTDDFFAAIRFLYVARARQAEFRRLSFVLIGVATPGDLIRDAKRTPFNVGKRVDLTEFQFDEALPLIQGLTPIASDPRITLAAILNWTGGQPFLTQKLCRLLMSGNEIVAGKEIESVAEVVRSHILNQWETQDNPAHLKTIRDRLLRGKDQGRGRLLGLYQQILLAGAVMATDAPEQIALQLSGLVVKRGSQLQVFNRIYQAVFNLDWLQEELAKLRPYGTVLQAWLDSGRTDESRLLRGQALAEVLDWAQDKRLDDIDRQFFEASQAIEKKTVEEALEAEKQANQVIAEARRNVEIALEEEREAHQRLREAQKNTRKLSITGLIVIAAVGSLSAIATVVGNRLFTPQITPEERLAMYAKPSVVQIVSGCAGEYINSKTDKIYSISPSYGTGFFVDSNGYIVTTASLVSSLVKDGSYYLDCQRILEPELRKQLAEEKYTDSEISQLLLDRAIKPVTIRQFRDVVLPNSNKTFPFEVKEIGIPSHKSKDVAIIKIEVMNAPVLELSTSNPSVQDPILTIGYLHSPKLDLASVEEPSVLIGRIANRYKILDDSAPILDISIASGSSGSPVLNQEGKVIGVLASTVSDSISIPFAVPKSTITEYLRAAGVINQASVTNLLYQQGLDFYWKGDFEAAKVKFEAVHLLFPQHSEAPILIRESEERMAENWTKSNYFYLLLALSIIVAAAITTILGRSYLRKQNKSA
jgi:S1-C subfamily serine protease